MSELVASSDVTPEVDPKPPKKKFSRGIRPDHIARGEAPSLYSNLENGAQDNPIFGSDHVTEARTNLGQSSDTNRAQTEHKSDTQPDTSSIKIFEEPKEAKATSSHLIQFDPPKVETKLSQSEAKLRTEARTNLGQSEAKVESKLSQSEAKLEPKLEPILEPKLSQSEAKLEPKFVFEELVGLQRNVLIHFFEMCVRSGNRITPPVAISNLALAVETTTSAGRKAIQRLEEKGFILRASFKDGRGGWTKYEIKEEVYKTLLLSVTSAKVEPIISQSRAKVRTQLEPKLEPSVPYSSSSNSLKENTTTIARGIPDEICFVIPSELTGKVSRRQLIDLVMTEKISESDLQLSLDAFAFDLKHNLVSMKHSSNPVGLLIGAIKNNGSYNSAKYVETLKSELWPFFDQQREVTQAKNEVKTLEDLEAFSRFKTEKKEEHERILEKFKKLGIQGKLLEEFSFLEFLKLRHELGETGTA